MTLKSEDHLKLLAWNAKCPMPTDTELLLNVVVFDWPKN